MQIYPVNIEQRDIESSPLLQQIHFSLLRPYLVAGMGEPWIDKMSDTHAALKRCGIAAILTLTEDDPYGEMHIKAGFQQRHEPINDGESPTLDGLVRSVAFINDCLHRGEGVAVHCLEGRGRTGTVLCAWLAATEQLNGESAIHRLRRLRPFTALSPAQKLFLLDYLE